jgi:uncharacterized protein
MPEPIAQPLARLRAVQELDTRRARLERDLGRLPREERERFAEYEAARLRLERGRDEVKRMKAEEHSLETDIRGREERLEKLRVQANMARDTATLLATNHQIQMLQDENSKAEDRALGLVERIGELESEFARQEAELAGVEKSYRAFAASCEAELASVKKELEQVDGKRADLLVGLDVELLDSYSKLLAARGGVAVCAVEDGLCSGCSTFLTPNDMMKLRGGRNLVRCKSCARILFLAT